MRSPFRPVLLALALVACKKSAPTEVREPERRTDAMGGAHAQAPRSLVVGDVTASVWSFPLAKSRVTLVDLGMSRDLAGAREKAGGDLAVNGGFFDPANRAEGLAISAGKELAPLDRALSGGVLVVDGRKGELFESESYLPGLTPPSFAIQCRPRLVVDKKRNIQKDDGKRAARTALCLRASGTVLDVIIARAPGADSEDGPTLYALAEALTKDGCEGALNLDGGPSTGVAYLDKTGAKDLPPTRKVRHALVVSSR